MLFFGLLIYAGIGLVCATECDPGEEIVIIVLWPLFLALAALAIVTELAGMALRAARQSKETSR